MLLMPLSNFYRHISLVTFRQPILHHNPVDVIMYVLFSRKVATIVNGWYSFKDQSAHYGLKGDLSPVILIAAERPKGASSNIIRI